MQGMQRLPFGSVSNGLILDSFKQRNSGYCTLANTHISLPFLTSHYLSHSFCQDSVGFTGLLMCCKSDIFKFVYEEFSVIC